MALAAVDVQDPPHEFDVMRAMSRKAGRVQ